MTKYPFFDCSIEYFPRTDRIKKFEALLSGNTNSTKQHARPKGAEYLFYFRAPLRRAARLLIGQMTAKNATLNKIHELQFATYFHS